MNTLRMSHSRDGVNGAYIFYALYAVLWLLLFLLQLSPAGPPAADGLDASYSAVMAWGLSEGQIWGRDLVFTYGPLGFLPQFSAYSQELNGAYLAGQIFLASAISLSIVQALANLSGVARWVFLLAIIVWLPWIALPLADALWLVFLGTSAVNLAFVAEHGASRARLSVMSVIYASGAAVLGLVKFTVLPISMMWVVVAASVLAVRGKGVFGLLLVLTYTLVFLAVWLTAQQPLSALPDYFTTSLELVEGYGPAMGVIPPVRTDVLGFTIMAFTGGWLGWQAFANRLSIDRMLIFLLLGCILYFSWRGAFTRADQHIRHFFPVASLLPLAAVALLVPRPGRLGISTHAVALLAISSLALFLVPEKVSPSLWVQALRVLPEKLSVLTDAARLRDESEAMLLSTSEKHALPKMKELVKTDTVDMLSWQQGVLLLNRFNYHPRPVFQGYTVYTPALLRMNEAFMLGKHAPQWIIFRIGTIDGRLPLTDDSLALLALLRRYDTVLEENGYILARRRSENLPPMRSPPSENYIQAKLGEWIDIPNAGLSALRVAYVETKPSLMGRLYALWFRGARLAIELRTADGKETSYRLVPKIGESGFIVSPLLRDNNDWLGWYTRSVELPEVLRLRIIPLDSSHAGMFQDDVRVAFQPLPDPRPALARLPRALSDVGSAGFSHVPSSREGVINRLLVDGRGALFMHSPAALRFPLKAGDYLVDGTFGLQAEVVSAPECAGSDGIRLALYAHANNEKTLLHKRDIDPFATKSPRMSDYLDFAFQLRSDGELELAMEPGSSGANMNCDWGYVSDFRILNAKTNRQIPWWVPTLTELGTHMAPMRQEGTCVLDAINGSKPMGAVVRAGAKSSFSGWMSDEAGNVPARALLMLQGEKVNYVVNLAGGVDRPDVAEAMQRPGLAKSGFDFSVQLDGVAPGSYRLSVIHTGSGRPAHCSLSSSLQVLAAPVVHGR